MIADSGLLSPPAHPLPWDNQYCNVWPPLYLCTFHSCHLDLNLKSSPWIFFLSLSFYSLFSKWFYFWKPWNNQTWDLVVGLSPQTDIWRLSPNLPSSLSASWSFRVWGPSATCSCFPFCDDLSPLNVHSSTIYVRDLVTVTNTISRRSCISSMDAVAECQQEEVSAARDSRQGFQKTRRNMTYRARNWSRGF